MASILKKYEGGLAFNEIEAFSRKSRQWYIDELKDLQINRQKLFRDTEAIKKNRFLPGKMYMYFYDPKYKDTLPYYDRFPLILGLETTKNGFFGLNLHYLDYMKRGLLLNRLMEFKTNNRYDETTRLRMSYNLLKKASNLKLFKPCLKQYLKSQMITPFKMIPAEYWETAIYIPSEQFKKKTKGFVFKESLKKARN